MTAAELSQFGYNLNDKWLRQMCSWFGIVWVIRTISRCLKNSFGYVGTKRIDRDFYQSLSDNDKKILKTVSDWLND